MPCFPTVGYDVLFILDDAGWFARYLEPSTIRLIIYSGRLYELEHC